MASKQMFAHEPFNCLVCRQWIGALQEAQDSEPDELESFVLCEGCGAVYLIMSTETEIRNLARLSPRLTWKLVPDALTPDPVRGVQAEIRASLSVPAVERNLRGPGGS